MGRVDTVMEQFEKVRKGLECCVLRDPDDHQRCGECPYNHHEISNAPCANGLKYNALALIRQQQERINELEAGQQWISVKDRLPTESNGTVLICYPNKAPFNLMEPYINAKHDCRVATGCYSQHSHTWYHGDMRGVGGADPIAWMPLPEPPKEEEHD